jgi:translation initiation factor IF-2
MQKVKRLFKIAKELNVGTAMLVEHLHDKGHDVENSPNAKISGELYEMLLKEFASDKQLKEKAEQMVEKRNEERLHLTAKPEPAAPAQPPKEESFSNDIMTAAELKSAIEKPSTPKAQPKSDTPEAKQSPSQEKKKSEETTSPEVPSQPEQPQKAAPTDQPKKEAESKKAEEKAEEKEEQKEEKKSSLKVLGKIDLDKVQSQSRKKKASSAKKAKEEEPPKDEKTAAKQKKAESASELQEVTAKKEKTSQTQEETPKQKPAAKDEPKQEEKAKAEVEKEAKKAEASKQSKAEEQTQPKKAVEEKTEEGVPQAEQTEAKAEGESVITADTNAPTLSGLKVLGRIDLPGKSRRGKGKKKDDSKKSSVPGIKSSEDQEGGNKRKRRRKRKRKKVPDQGTTSSENKGGSNRGKSTKEKPSKKEIDESIRSTMAQMQRGPSRDRQRLRRAKRDADAERRRRQQMQDAEKAQEIEVTEFITANEFANLINVPVNEIIKLSFSLGKMITINQRLDQELLELLGEEFGYVINLVDIKDQDFEAEEIEDDPEDLKPRNPIITVMGHVDHGKTTLLDHLRKANVAAGEAGGITQHIGAYLVKGKSGQQIAFLDTPGHEAFTAMRARGAQVTDVVIVVIAADDAVMPQTKEAINHSQAAGVPMIFAINKVDKPSADPEKIKAQLAEMNILVEDWGGEYQSQEISAKNGQGVEELLEKVLIQAELMELQANPDRLATGAVIESSVEKGRGNVATILVQKGTLRVGDPMVAGIHFGKVRALTDQNGDRIKEAGPSTPVQVLGLNGQPGAGDRFQVFSDEATAKNIAQKRQELFREQAFRQNNRLTLEELTRRRALGSFSELNIIIKGDVDGSVEALAGSLLKLGSDEVQVNIILKSVGGITESDVNLAMASEAVIIAFNTRPNAQARSLAEREGIDIRTYSVIYDAINDVKDALEGLLSPDIKEEILGTAEVRDSFKISRVGTIAGCMVTSGKILRNGSVRVIRDGVVIYTSTVSSLKRFKDDAKEVVAGYECGIMIENYNDIKVGDVFECFKEVEVKRTLS